MSDFNLGASAVPTGLPAGLRIELRVGLRRIATLALAVGLATTAACTRSDDTSSPTSPSQPSVPISQIPGHEDLVADRGTKEGPRLLPQEALIRTYLQLFGGLAPRQAQAALRAGSPSLFDGWTAYLDALGLPEHAVDQPRMNQSNSLMLATFERIGIALCDKAVDHDLRGTTALPLKERYIFAFDAPPGDLNEVSFKAPFDTLHRTFLGYPSELAEPDRATRFLRLFNATRQAHEKDPPGKGFTPSQVAWASVCYGLIRHPEFHVY